MVNKCGVVNCRGNYDASSKCRVFRLPKQTEESKTWLDVLPPRENYDLDPLKFFICEKHWPVNTPMMKIPGGSTRPVEPPSIFDVPPSCLPSQKFKPRPPKDENRHLNNFNAKDKIISFDKFLPEKEIRKKYKEETMILSRKTDKLVVLFMTADYSEVLSSVIVYNKRTLCSPLVVSAFKDGTGIALGKILNPNNGLGRHSQFFDVLNFVKNFTTPTNTVIHRVVKSLEAVQESLNDDIAKSKRLQFLTRQLQLFINKTFKVSDYCFALESFPHCSYNQLRELLVLPSKRKLQIVLSATGIDDILIKMFKKIECVQQKYCFLLVDEVKIRPTVAYSGGILSGMAKNNPESRASSMLCVMLRCLHGGPSIMLSVTPVHKLTAEYQYSVVIDVAKYVEKAGGIVIGSITDNHKINQHYCKLFDSRSENGAEAVHPLDDERVWFLLYDTVHLLKCIRNNWITGNFFVSEVSEAVI